MLQNYILEYRTGWGEQIRKEFKARNLKDAHTIAKNYCIQQYIHIARLISPTNRIYCI